MSANTIMKKMIDIGANLTDPVFKGIYHSSLKHRDDFFDMLKRATENGVEKMIVTGGSLEDSQIALRLAQQHDNLYSTVGCHPTRCNEFNDHPEGSDRYLKELMDLASSDKTKVVAIGELGLDYDRLHFCDAATQRTYFERQLEVVPALRLPLFLHNRNSIQDFLDILKRHQDKFKDYGGVVHSFDGSHDDVRKILDLGLHIGLNGCSLKTERNLEVVKQIPSDRLMIETDCPWCEIKRTHASFKYVKTNPTRCKDASDPKLPVKNRNEPMNIVQVLEVLAAVRGEDIDMLSQQIYDNTNKLFFKS